MADKETRDFKVLEDDFRKALAQARDESQE